MKVLALQATFILHSSTLLTFLAERVCEEVRKFTKAYFHRLGDWNMFEFSPFSSSNQRVWRRESSSSSSTVPPLSSPFPLFADHSSSKRQWRIGTISVVGRIYNFLFILIPSFLFNDNLLAVDDINTFQQMSVRPCRIQTICHLATLQVINGTVGVLVTISTR